MSKAQLKAPEVWYPLRLLVCESCWLVQTQDHADRESLFTDDYAYFSSFSTSWLAHAQSYVQEMAIRFDLNASSCVVEIAANDGYLLQYVKATGISCYGVEPTAGTAAAARTKGIEIVEAFFGLRLAQDLLAAGKQADLMVANNVLAHVPDINDFVAGFAVLLKPNGVVTFEFPHLLRMLQDNQFDTAYHEHYSYLSLIAVDSIFARNGLAVFDVQELSTHGGSLRIFAQRSDSGSHSISGAVEELRQIEVHAGMNSTACYTNFQAQAERIKDDLLAFLIECKRQGLKVGGYGAAAKGNTLLNFAGVRHDLLPYVVDKNPAKHGKFMPGSRISIVEEGHLKAHRPDRILILPWNLSEEVQNQLAYAYEWGGRFVTAVPNLQVRT